MENYKPNSHTYKKQQKEDAVNKKKKVDKVVKGSVKTKKKNGVSKFADVFITEDIAEVKSHLFVDVFVPTVKKLISDGISDAVDMILYGGTRDRKSRTGASKVSYRDYYDRRDERRYRDDHRRRSGYRYDDIILDNRGEAEEVLSQLEDIIDTYKVATVADLHDLVGITGEYTDENYGWTNLGRAEVVRCRDGGYMLKLPRALAVD